MPLPKLIIISFFVLGLVLPPPAVFVSAETSLQQTSQQAQDEKNLLEQQLKDIESQIAQYQQELSTIKGEKNTLQNKIKQLQKQQSAINLQIRATNLRIAQLSGQLVSTKSAIEESLAKTARLKQQIAELILAIDQNDSDPFIYSLVSVNRLSDAMDEIENFFQLSDSLRDLLGQTAQAKIELDQHAQTLAQQQDAAKDLLSIKILQQQELSGSVNEQNDLLQATKGKESAYQAALSDTQKKAAEIRNRLYQLLGVPTQITFGEAVKIAQWASGLTGVRAAFLLAVLTQESNLGKNVGTCNRAGDPPSKSWRVIMKPDRDQEPFVQITQELGLDTDTTPVSCPMRDSRGNQVGWGGAMGPAQFIPSTWMGYKDKVTAITGKIANPWDIRDAFIAAAIKLGAGGATSQSGEWAAAMRYFSGSTNTRYRFYGDNVVAMANQYQNDIDSLNNQ